MDFPRLRFQQAGASPDELDALEARFDALSEPEQEGQLNQWAGVATGDLVEYLEAERERAAEIEERDEEPQPAQPAPPATTSSSSPGNGGKSPSVPPAGDPGDASTS